MFITIYVKLIYSVFLIKLGFFLCEQIYINAFVCTNVFYPIGRNYIRLAQTIYDLFI